MSSLLVVTYHYVRDLPNTRFPRIKALLTESFRQQVDALQSHYEMATWDAVVGFLKGEYRPSRDLCYLTFDDGLKDHYTTVLPILAERGITGAFFLITDCLDGRSVATAHKNHFLMAELGFEELYDRFMRRIHSWPSPVSLHADEQAVRQAHPWDDLRVARYKYLVNYGLPLEVREQVLNSLFAGVFGDEGLFSDDLYLNWAQVEDMRQAGMMIGGHSSRHRALATLSYADQAEDIQRCQEILSRRCPEIAAPPFSYPYGMADSFSQETMDLVRQAGFSAAFTFMPGINQSGSDPFRLQRMDTNQVQKAV